MRKQHSGKTSPQAGEHANIDEATQQLIRTAERLKRDEEFCGNFYGDDGVARTIPLLELSLNTLTSESDVTALPKCDKEMVVACVSIARVILEYADDTLEDALDL